MRRVAYMRGKGRKRVEKEGGDREVEEVGMGEAGD